MLNAIGLEIGFSEYYDTLLTNTCSKLKVENYIDKMAMVKINNKNKITITCCTKQLKCTLKNRAVSLKHVPVTWVKQHGLNNP